MAIKIYNNRIEFLTGSNVITLTETVDGFSINGTITADSFGGLLQGKVYGYSSGGLVNPPHPSPGSYNSIQRFPFSYDADSSDVADLSATINYAGGNSSDVNGYSSGGTTSPGSFSNSIQRFPFASTFTSSVQNSVLTQARTAMSTQSSFTHGYLSGGLSVTNIIDKFSFSTASNASDVGDLTQGRYRSSGLSSTVAGFTAGGITAPVATGPTVRTNVIDKFPFASDTSASDVADLALFHHSAAGISSLTQGYVAGGDTNPSIGGGNGTVNTISKFPFATNVNSYTSGSLSQARQSRVGLSSTNYGYVVGGSGPTAEGIDTIDKFLFASDSNATDVGNLTVLAFGYGSGQQY